MNRGFIGALCLSVVFALLAGCGGSQPPIAAPGALPQTSAMSRGHAAAHHVLTGPSYEVLHRFSIRGHTHAARPLAGLIEVNGTLYGTTNGKTFPSKAENGTVYSMSTSGVTKTLYRFHGSDGSEPSAVLLDVDGTLYGTTYYGGAFAYGTVFSMTTNGVENVVYSFKGGSDGANPQAGLIDVNGTLYGTTFLGGGGQCTTPFGGQGCGTVYSVSTAGAEKVLHSFNGSDGANPAAELLDVNGTLYGTTFGGGGYSSGSVFSITRGGSEKTLYEFTGGTDGDRPFAPLINVNGTLYGTTEHGGSAGNGNVYSITTTGSENQVYSFAGGSDGDTPIGGLIDVNGTLYGTTVFGGGSACQIVGSGCGVAFSLTTGGSENVLYRFQSGSDGAEPNGDLANVNGRLYGTTVLGGGSGCSHLGCGTVYALSP